MSSLFSALRDVFRQLRVAYSTWRAQVLASLRADWIRVHAKPMIPRNLPTLSVRRHPHDHKAVIRGRLKRDCTILTPTPRENVSL